MTGYPTNASILPALLAAYRKYGSREEVCAVLTNHFCSNGVVVDKTKNGNPTDRINAFRSHRMGDSTPSEDD